MSKLVYVPLKGQLGDVILQNQMKKVIMYSTPTCHYCNLAKDFFDEHNVEYDVHNVSTDLEKRKEMMDKSGQMGVPVICIGDDLVLGFDEEKIKDLLGL